MTAKIKGLKHVTKQQELATYSYRSASHVRADKRAHAAKVARHAARKPVGGFVDFLRERAVVALAIGFVLGTQVQTVVKQVIDSFVNPLFQLLFPGNKALNSRTFTLDFHHRSANFGWGAIAYAFLDFLFVAVTVYVIIKIFQLDKLDKQS